MPSRLPILLKNLSFGPTSGRYLPAEVAPKDARDIRGQILRFLSATSADILRKSCPTSARMTRMLLSE
jgi:hypothetical protein